MQTIERDPRLDWVRAWAILLVIVYHSGKLDIPGWATLTSGGFVANTIFVGMSGFLLARRLPVSTKSWAARRLTRIMVPYWVVLVALIAIGTLTNVYRTPDIFEILAYISGLHYFLHISLLGPHLWFVSFILLAYATFPLYLRARGQSRGAEFVILVLVLVLSFVLLTGEDGTSYGRVSSTVLGRLIYHLIVFWIFMLVGDRCSARTLELPMPRWLVAVGLASLPAYLLAAPSLDRAVSFLGVAAGLAVATVTAKVIFSVGSLALRSRSVAGLSRALATHSYEMYLVHYVLIDLMVRMRVRWAGLLLLIPLSFLFAIVVRRITNPLTARPPRAPSRDPSPSGTSPTPPASID